MLVMSLKDWSVGFQYNMIRQILLFMWPQPNPPVGGQIHQCTHNPEVWDKDHIHSCSPNQYFLFPVCPEHTNFGLMLQAIFKRKAAWACLNTHFPFHRF
jgi:hypothetical protein